MGKVLDKLWSPFSQPLKQSSIDSLSEEKYRSHVSLSNSSSRSSRPRSFTSSSLYDLDITSLSSAPSSCSIQSTRSLRRSRSKLSAKPSYSSDEELLMMSSVAQLEGPRVQKARLMSVPSLNPSQSDLSSSTNTLIPSTEYNHGIHH
jgi:hypothetical protein